MDVVAEGRDFMRHFRTYLFLFGLFSFASVCLMQRFVIYSLKNENAEIKRLAAEVLAKNPSSLWTASYVSRNLEQTQYSLSLLEEPSYATDNPGYEEKSAMLRDHLLLSVRPSEGEPSTARLLISPDWMMSVLDSADREVQELRLKLERKHGTANDKEIQSSLGACPYLGTTSRN